MIKVTIGDSLHAYGSQGLGLDYAVRLEVQMQDSVDGDLLRKAVDLTARRYPYLLLRPCCNEAELYYEENAEPVVLLNTDQKITLASAQTNGHVWAVCYKGDRIDLDIYHGIADGTGMYMVLSTLLYYYCHDRYGVTDHTGIRTLEDAIEQNESVDPQDHFPQIDLSKFPAPALPEVFSVIRDGGAVTDEKNYISDVKISEEEFMKLCNAYEASPGTMVSLLIAKAISALNPDTDKPLNGSYAYNGRPMLGALLTHHNCVGTNVFQYSDKLKNLPFEMQVTSYRGMIFVQSDADRVRQTMAVSAAREKMILQVAPTYEAKKAAFAKMLIGGKTRFTYMVSYVGKWKYASVEPYIRELWTHVPAANEFLTEIAAVNGNLFLSIHQSFLGDEYLSAFLTQLEEHGIAYELVRKMESDAAHFPVL